MSQSTLGVSSQVTCIVPIIGTTSTRYSWTGGGERQMFLSGFHLRAGEMREFRVMGEMEGVCVSLG